MVRGRVTGFFRLIEKEVPTSEQPYRLDLLSQVSTTCAEMYIRLQRAHGDLAKPEKASARLVLVCRNDGKLLRFNGSTKAILGYHFGFIYVIISTKIHWLSLAIDQLL